MIISSSPAHTVRRAAHGLTWSHVALDVSPIGLKKICSVALFNIFRFTKCKTTWNQTAMFASSMKSFVKTNVQILVYMLLEAKALQHSKNKCSGTLSAKCKRNSTNSDTCSALSAKHKQPTHLLWSENPVVNAIWKRMPNAKFMLNQSKTFWNHVRGCHVSVKHVRGYIVCEPTLPILKSQKTCKSKRWAVSLLDDLGIVFIMWALVLPGNNSKQSRSSWLTIGTGKSHR